MVRYFLLIYSWSLILPGAVAAADDRPHPRPNFVIIFADDLGYGDLGCYGHPTIRTPNLDRMAAEGMRFTQFYSAATVCTPSRAALLTGRYAIRSGLCGPGRVLFPDSKGGLPDSEITLAEALRDAGYRTGCIGKWHLGSKPSYLPTRHGFDSYFGIPYSNDMGADTAGGRLRKWPPLPLLRGEKEIEQNPDQRTLTKRYTQEALQFIRGGSDSAAAARPFFLYLAHSMPHVPLAASDAFQGRSPRGLYGDVIEELDWSTGEILQALRDLKLAENTLVFFTSDNGPWLSQKTAGGSAGLLREGKGSTWEGGMREPGIAWWPGHIPSGRVSATVACTLDLFPTFLTLAGSPVPVDRPYDGFELTRVLSGVDESPRKVFFYYRDNDLAAVRKGPWKAHFRTQAGYGQKKPDLHDPPLLFHLEHDPGEHYNAAAEHSDVIEDLRREVQTHESTIERVPLQF